MAEVLRKAWNNVMRRRFLRMGLPFVIFVAGGSFYLKQFSAIRYDFRQGRMLTEEECESMGIKMMNVTVVQEEMLKEIEQVDLDNWENVRGPRPWEDSKTVQNAQRQKLKQKEDTNSGHL